MQLALKPGSPGSRLVRLRWAFALLALGLLLVLAFLVQTALSRLEHQRALRHEVVAERVFDELERELNAHLERESARPSDAYDTASLASTWAPFVVGYFTLEGRPLVVSRAQLAPERAARIDRALKTLWPASPDEDLQRLSPRNDSGVSQVRSAASDADALAPTSKTAAVRKQAPDVELSKTTGSKFKSDKALDQSPEVLRRLNRAQESRKRAPNATVQDPFAF